MMKAAFVVAALAVFAGSTAASATIVNLGADLGFAYDGGGSDPAPVAGQHINFIGDVPELTLGPGVYLITNGTGQTGADPDYTAWSYAPGAWTWGFVLAKADGTVIDYQSAGYGSSQAEVANLYSVRGFLSYFALSTTTTVAFTLRDYHVADNAGGIALNVRFLPPVPEPAAWLSLTVGLAGAGLTVKRRRRTMTAAPTS